MAVNYGKTGYKVSDLFLGKDKIKEKTRNEIDNLTRKKDFFPATFYDEDNNITFTSWDSYEDFLRFLRKLVHLRGNINTTVKITDEKDDTYWTVRIKGRSIIEQYGTIIWGSEEEKAKVKSVLEAHIEASPETVNEIIDQVFQALKGYYTDEALDSQEEELPLEEADKDVNGQTQEKTEENDLDDTENIEKIKGYDY